jgi:hypothetical protein
MLKEGYDHFEVTHLEPKVDFCEKRYVFDAQQPANSSKPLKFDASGKCPVYEVPADIADAVKAKGEQDDADVTQLVARNEPTAPLKRGIDGGMNAVFAAKLPDGQTGLSDGRTFTFASSSSYDDVPATLPYQINPPRAPDQQPTTSVVTPSADGAPAAASAAATTASATRVASAEAPAKEGFLSGLARKMGFGKKPETDTAATAAAPKPKVAELKPAKPAPAPAAKPAAPRIESASAQAALKPAIQDTGKPEGTTGTVPGSQPVVSSNSFDSRFSAFR